jgi:hypothetical protein
MSVMSVMLSLLLSLPCPALPYLCCVSRCSCGAASTVPYRSPGALGPRLSLGTCDARLHSAKVPCAEDKVPVVAGTWPPAHQYNASTPPLSGRALFFFFRYLHQGLPAWAPLQLGGAPVTTTVDTPPSHSFILRLALRVSSHRVLLPCVHVHAICWLAQSRTTARA